MIVEQKIGKKNKLIYRKCISEITIETIFEQIQNLFSEKSFERNMNSIWDFRLATININKSELKNLYPALKTVEDKRGDKYKVAIWVLKTDDYFLSSIHTALSIFNKMPFETLVFKYRDEVLEWFNIDPYKIDYF